MIRLSTATPSSQASSGKDKSSLSPIFWGEGRGRLYTGYLNPGVTLPRESVHSPL